MNPVRDVQGGYMKSNNYNQSGESNGSHNRRMRLISASCL